MALRLHLTLKLPGIAKSNVCCVLWLLANNFQEVFVPGLCHYMIVFLPAAAAGSR